MTIVSLVAMEKGSEWPGHVGDCESLVALTASDDAGELLDRTRRRLASLGHQGQHVRVAVLACNHNGCQIDGSSGRGGSRIC